MPPLRVVVDRGPRWAELRWELVMAETREDAHARARLARLDRTQEECARELGVSVDDARREADSHSALFDAARARASRLNVPVRDLLESDRRYMETSAYPGPNCYQPFELDEFMEGRLSRERLAHRETCDPCSVLLAVMKPSLEHLRQFEAAAREVPVVIAALGHQQVASVSPQV